jgi:hypothetical protein
MIHSTFRLAAALMVSTMAAAAADAEFRIPPLPVRLDVEGRALSVTLSGTIVPGAVNEGRQSVRVKLDADLADLQRNVTELLRSHVDQSPKCGERLSVTAASIMPAAPTAELTAKLHVEKYGCAKALGREIVKKLVGGDGVLKVRLTPELDDGALGLKADVTSVEANGELGQILKNETVGDALREKIRRSVVAALDKITDLEESLPDALRELVEVKSAEFRGGGDGQLVLALTSEVRLPEEEARKLLERAKSARD